MSEIRVLSEVLTEIFIAWLGIEEFLNAPDAEMAGQPFWGYMLFYLFLEFLEVASLSFGLPLHATTLLYTDDL